MNNKQKMTKDIVPQDFTMKLAIVDAFPVILFGISCILAGALFHSVIFVAGAALSTVSGLIKVAWKVIVVKRKQNVWWMFVQMRVLLPAGFLIMLVGLILVVKEDYASITDIGTITLAQAREMAAATAASGLTWAQFWMQLVSLPALIFFTLGVIGVILMVIFMFTMDSSSLKANWREQITNTLTQAAFCIGIICVTILPDYGAGEEAYFAIYSCNEISVTDEASTLIFDPGNTDTGIILYPGAKVDYRAYAPLLKACAERGIFASTVQVPSNIAFLGKSRAEAIIDKYPQIKHWYIAGHSLGGVVGSSFAYEYASDIDANDSPATTIDGIIYLASYPSKDLRGSGLKALMIRGSEDKVLNLEKYEESVAENLDSYEELVIEGGCHAYFGDYGEQRHDGVAGVSFATQIQVTVDAIADFVE